MPYIQTRTNISIDNNRQEQIKSKLGEAITLIGKSENWLMIEFVDNCNLYFKGQNNTKIAYVNVELFGSSSKESYNNMTSKITEILQEELQIEPSNIYVSYKEVPNWGWNGNNF